MKQMQIYPDGTLHYPVCSSSQFTFKRTGAGKVTAGVFAPKRAHCLGCGANLRPHIVTRAERRERWNPETVDITKHPLLAPTVGEALAIRKARKAAKKAAKGHNSTQ